MASRSRCRRRCPQQPNAGRLAKSPHGSTKLLPSRSQECGLEHVASPLGVRCGTGPAIHRPRTKLCSAALAMRRKSLPSRRRTRPPPQRSAPDPLPVSRQLGVRLRKEASPACHRPSQNHSPRASKAATASSTPSAEAKRTASPRRKKRERGVHTGATNAGGGRAPRCRWPWRRRAAGSRFITALPPPPAGCSIHRRIHDKVEYACGSLGGPCTIG